MSLPRRPVRRVAALTALAMGVGLAACSGTTDPPLPPPEPVAVVLNPGETRVFSASEGGVLTIPGSAQGDYALTVFNAATGDEPSLALEVTGTGLGEPAVLAGATAGAGAFARLEGSGDEPLPITDAPVMERFRRLARHELAPRVEAARAARLERRAERAALRRATLASAAAVGDLLSLNVRTDSGCAAPELRNARVAAVSNRAIIAVDVDNPAGGFSDAEYASIAATFDTLVYPVDVRHFGAPTDLDGNGKVVIFYTRAVNELTPANENFVVGGFFWNRDIFPKTGGNGCAGSNDGELFYMLAPDPAGVVNGNRRTKGYVDSSTVAVLAHELQHLINATRRLYELQTNNFDEVIWLNEGLSHVAEELLFYRSANLSPAGQPGQSPRARLTITELRNRPGALVALNSFNNQNLSRLSRYLRSTSLGRTTERASPYADDDSLSTRGATWSFLRYAIDRTGQSDSVVLQRLVNTNQLGLANLRAATGAGGALADWFRDWSVSNFVDGLAPGVNPAFVQRSWNFRSVLPALSSNNGAYPLTPRQLENAAPQTVTLVSGGAGYLTLSVAGDATIRVRAAGGTTLPGNARLSLVRVR